MRWLAFLFAALILALQYPMWLGKGGWLQVRETDRQLAAQREANAKLKARNEADVMAAEIFLVTLGVPREQAAAIARRPLPPLDN